VGKWVDAMVRLEGPGVAAPTALFRWDWEVETGRDPGASAAGGDPAAAFRIWSSAYFIRKCEEVILLNCL
jgi:phosphatidylserine/phosphatidylglycerophosphate/cardiolipin synthase-like enzyme